MARIGLVAGGGDLPGIFSKAAKEKGDTVIVFALKGVTDENIGLYADKVHWLGWGNLQKALFLLVTDRIRKIVMLGKIRKDVVLKGDGELDDTAKKMMSKLGDKKDYAILNEITNVLKKMGVEVLDSTLYLKEFMPKKGTLTKRVPSVAEQDDIEYGKRVAHALAGFDIGQTVVIKDKSVVAIEAAEGTDETIKRAGALTKGGFVVVKVARPNQDMRFDVPLIGVETLKTVIENNGKVMAIEAEKTLIIDQEELVKLADEKDISIVVV